MAGKWIPKTTNGLVCPICHTWYADAQFMRDMGYRVGGLCGDTSLKRPDEPPCQGRLVRCSEDHPDDSEGGTV